MKNWEEREIKKEGGGGREGVESSLRKAWGIWRQSLLMQDKGYTKDR